MTEMGCLKVNGVCRNIPGRLRIVMVPVVGRPRRLERGIIIGAQVSESKADELGLLASKRGISVSTLLRLALSAETGVDFLTPRDIKDVEAARTRQTIPDAGENEFHELQEKLIA